MAAEERLTTVGDVRRAMKGLPNEYPVRATYYYDTGCETCGMCDEEGDLVIVNLETRVVFEARESERKP